MKTQFRRDPCHKCLPLKGFHAAQSSVKNRKSPA
jgi:hypothetical protein